MRAEIDPATGHVHAAIDAIGGDDAFQNGLDASLTVAGPAGLGAARRAPQGADAADRAGSLRGRLPARSLRLVPPPRVAREAGRRRATRQAAQDRHGRRELRSRDQPVPARVPRARARRRDAGARRGGRPAAALDPAPADVFDPGRRGDPLPRGPLAALRRRGASRSSCSICSSAACASSTASGPSRPAASARALPPRDAAASTVERRRVTRSARCGRSAGATGAPICLQEHRPELFRHYRIRIAGITFVA